MHYTTSVELGINDAGYIGGPSQVAPEPSTWAIGPSAARHGDCMHGDCADPGRQRDRGRPAYRRSSRRH